MWNSVELAKGRDSISDSLESAFKAMEWNVYYCCRRLCSPYMFNGYCRGINNILNYQLRLYHNEMYQ